MSISSTRRFRVLAPLALAAVCFAQGNQLLADEADAADSAASIAAAKSHFEQAADSIIAGAKETIAATESDEEAAKKASLVLESLRIVCMFGDMDTDATTDKLLDEIRDANRPAVVDAIVLTRLSNKLRQWPKLDDAGRTKAIDEFIASTKKGELTAAPAKMLVQLSNMLGDGDQSALVAKAINEILPTARESSDAMVKRMVPLFEGIVRRIELPGKPLELEGTLIDGSQLDWSSYRGKVVLVDFHASWCGPCRAEVPNILENYEAYHDKGFEVIGVNLDTERKAADEYIEQTGFKFPTLFSDDPEASGWDNPMSQRYGITAIPRVILVDKDGVVVNTMARGTKLGEHLEKLLGPAETPSDEGSDSSKDAGKE